MLGKCSIKCHLEMKSLKSHDIGTHEVWEKVEVIKIILTNIIGKCVAKLSCLCGGVECMC